MAYISDQCYIYNIVSMKHKIIVLLLTHHYTLPHNGFAGVCVSSTPNRFFTVTRCRENLSSGENRASNTGKPRI